MLTRHYWPLLVAAILVQMVGSKKSSILGRGSSSGRSSPTGFGGTGGSSFGGGGFSPQRSNFPQQPHGGFGQSGGFGGHNTGTFNRGGTSGGFGGFGSSNHGFPSQSRSSGGGIGGVLRSNSFKGAFLGAAGGMLAYEAGKYLIKSAMQPVMYNNRPYYWGSDYYQPRPNTQMCRMSIDSSDPQFGNRCCGQDCCPNNGGGTMPSNIAMNSNGGGGLPPNCKVSGTGIDLSLRPSQAVGVRGTLKCNGMPASGVLVKLYDHDTFTIDDKIASGRTDANGNFCIAGHANEITRITPKFNVYHDCDDWL
ncbi:CX module family protein, partial [Aphelenchoides avenae]